MKNILKQTWRSALKSFVSTFILFILHYNIIMSHNIYILNQIHVLFWPTAIANYDKKETFYIKFAYCFCWFFLGEQISNHVVVFCSHSNKVNVPTATSWQNIGKNHKNPQLNSISLTLSSISINCVCASNVKQPLNLQDITIKPSMNYSNVFLLPAFI